MAIGPKHLLWFKELSAKLGVLFPHASVMDIGSSNLYDATADQIREFITYYNPNIAADAQRLDEFCRRAAENATVGPGITTTWVGEVMEWAGLNYRSFDIFQGYGTEIFDLNCDSLPPRHFQQYDLVMNFGTTEHLFNQYNAFKVIHELAMPGGFIFHQLPTMGYLDHGYFNYQPKVFDCLRVANAYDLISIGYDDPQGFCNYYEQNQHFENHDKWKEYTSPNGVIYVLFRKTSDAPFSLSLDVSTTSGSVQEEVATRYQAAETE
jgi:hypothetical protein